MAREASADCWPRLKRAAETAALTKERRNAALDRAVANRNFLMVDRLLLLDAGLADAHVGLWFALARRDAVLAAPARAPSTRIRSVVDIRTLA